MENKTQWKLPDYESVKNGTTDLLEETQAIATASLDLLEEVVNGQLMQYDEHTDLTERIDNHLKQYKP